MTVRTETPTERAVRLAMRCGELLRRAVTAEQEVQRLRALLEANGIDPTPPGGSV